MRQSAGSTPTALARYHIHQSLRDVECSRKGVWLEAQELRITCRQNSQQLDEKPLMPKAISTCTPPLLSGWTGHGDRPSAMLALRSSLTPFRRGDAHSPSWLISVFPETSALPDAQ